MIVFKNLKFKNFLSTGDNWTEIDLDSSPTTLIVGNNGAGKSTMLDALSFALFGKAHRNISKPQLVNSINNKACLVEVVFNTLGSEYKVIRGIKPNKFEIWRDGDMINQASNAKDYQKMLEQNILKLNHKSFHQIVVLGSSSFVPFMQLTSANRREVIEDLLDINVFSKMNTILKEQISALKGEIQNVSHQIEINQTKTVAQERYIQDIQKMGDEQREKKQQFISDNQNEIEALQRKNEELDQRIQSELPSASSEQQKKTKKLSELEKYKAKFDADIRKLLNDVSFFQSNDTCPTCSQTITEETKETHILAKKAKAKEIKGAIEEADKAIERSTECLRSANDILEKCRRWQSEMATNNSTIAVLQKSISNTQTEIANLAKSIDMDEAVTKLDGLKDEASDLKSRKLDLSEQYNYNMVVAQMLKDTGIKTKIIKQYMPVINKLVNNYLQILDFFVSFHLDDSFQETIKSRYRDAFSYASFSEGEKQRIDLALLFTWRQIAKMKNSVATNLLVLDETFDSSLDHEGIDNLMKIIYSLKEDSNVFVISHKGEMLDGRFSRKLEVVKEKNFSRIK